MNPYPLVSLNHLTEPRCFNCGPLLSAMVRLEFVFYEAPTPLPARTDWKQSRQYTGLPAVGLKGTWVVTPHEEQTASWNSREDAPDEIGEAVSPPAAAPPPCRFFSSRQRRQRVGSC